MKQPNLISGPFTRIQWEPINLNSSAQIKDYLFQHGWVPDEWNYKKGKNGFLERDDLGNPIKTSPKLTESSFHTVKGDIPRLIARRNVLIHRKRLVDNLRKDGEETGLLHLVRSDGRISASAIPNATNTGRAAHKGVVNIPGVEATYGKEIRELFIVPDDKILLGIDAQALEARCLGHFLLQYPGGEAVVDILLNGDIHQSNADLWGCSRKEAKSPYYALLFGAQPPKLAQTMGCSLERAKDIFNNFWEYYTPLKEFKEGVTNSWKGRGGKKGGFLKGLDGRKLFARSEHSLVNLMIQSTGSILVKTAMVWIHKEIKRQGIPANQVIWMHDEMQYEVDLSFHEELKTVAEGCFLKAGKFWKLRVPLIGEAKFGRNWAETH